MQAVFSPQWIPWIDRPVPSTRQGGPVLNSGVTLTRSSEVIAMSQKRSKYEGLNSSDRARARMRYIGKTPNGHPLWTKREDEVVRQLFPDHRAIKKRLRRRSRQAIHHRAEKLNLAKRMNLWTTTEISVLRKRWRDAPRQELVAALPRHSWDGIRAKAQVLRLSRPRKLKITGKRLLDLIRRRSIDLKIPLTDLDRICVGRHYFSDSSRRSQKPRRNVLLRAIAALGGRVEIVWQ